MRMRIGLAALLLIGCSALPSVAQEPVYTDNVVIVLDGSGSMKQKMRRAGVTKMNAAKSALHQVLAQMPETTHVGVIAFSSGAKRPWLAPLGKMDLPRVRQAIDGLMPDGGTPLGRYMKLGADRLLEQRAAQYGYGTYRVLVVTDGEADDADLVNKYTADIIARGITVDVIGVEMSSDHTLATRVHSYRRADDPESLRSAIAEVFAEVSAAGDADTAAEDAFAIIAPLPSGVAVAMVRSLATSGNEPIGQKPKVVSQPRAPRGGMDAGKSHTVPFPLVPERKSGLLSVLLNACFVGVVVIVVLGIVVAVLKRGRR
jgi:uncharacterized protein YegL